MTVHPFTLLQRGTISSKCADAPAGGAKVCPIEGCCSNESAGTHAPPNSRRAALCALMALFFTI